ncbi:MAG TPA: glycosyltransferase family 4 protein [Aggregatilineales bacterium]|nr:glycosyltransferase family 4 protein [Anaerolineales bacterium]HRE46500.1 glycosyltransferase family 4 protein [Aggregatilineales bacterium]
MKILYLHQYFCTPEGSAGTRSYEFARRWVAAGHEVTMITSPAYLPERFKAFTTVTETLIDTIPTVIIPVPYANKMSFSQRIRAFGQFALRASREAMRREADVIFATSTPLTIAIPAIAAKLRRRVPMVFEVRDLWPELPIAIGALKNPLFRWAAYALEWIAYHNARHIIALSPGMSAGIQKRGIPAERISVQPNSCDVALFDIPPERGESIREQLGLRPDQPLIVYSGAFGVINGVDYWVRVAAELRQSDPDIHILLVGMGAEVEKVTALARELGVLGVNVTIWKPVKKEEMPTILAAATVGSSLFKPIEAMWHNSANKFFDTLAAGKPVVINYGGWQGELLEETGAGIALPPEDFPRAAALLAAFLRDEGRLAGGRKAARDLAANRFHRDTIARGVEGVLMKAAAGR